MSHKLYIAKRMAESSREINAEDIDNYQWDLVSQPLEEYLCTLCSEVLYKPMLTECCGCHFCEACIEPIINHKNICPSCSKVNFICILDKAKWRRILELDVHCPLKSRGCTWTGELRMRGAHLDPLTGDCPYMDLDCSYGCGQSVERYELAEHLEMFCSQRPSVCEHCGAEDIHEYIGCDHLLKCPEYPIPCPNDCGIGYIKLSVSEQHLLECPEQRIPCDFSHTGCQVQLPRKHMAKHLAQNLHLHLKLQSVFISKKLARSTKISQDAQRSFQESELESRKLENILQEKFKASNKQEKQLQDITLEGSQIIETLAEKFCRLVLSLNHTHEQLEEKVKHELHQKQDLLWELDRSQLELISKVASGQFTEVWTGLQYRKKQVAIKKHKLGTSTSLHFLQEALIMKNLQHKNLLQLCGVCTGETPLLIVTEFMCHGNLLDYLHKSLSLPLQIDILHQIASGMAYLENLNCIHRSVLSRSMLIGNSLVCKVGSFGSARILEKEVFEYTIPQGERVPIKWSAPEVLRNNRFSVKSDVWAFGILQYELFTHSKLKISNSKAEQLIKSGTYLEIPPGCPQRLYSIMTDCWKDDPQMRPTFGELAGLRFKDFELREN